MLELGTGWFPVIPVYYYLNGADNIYTIDHNPLLFPKNVKATIAKFLSYSKSGKLDMFNKNPVNERLKNLQDIFKKIGSLPLDRIMEEINIRTIVGDASNLDIATRSVDLICSNNTFEHISPEILEKILKEFKRIIVRNGVMSHFIDMTDHFEHIDKSITIYNFLKFSDKKWKLINNSIQPQNRERITFYRELYNKLGIELDEEISKSGDVEAVRKINLDKQFSYFSPDEIAVYHSLLISHIK